MLNWGRLLTAMVTPFDEQYELDYEQAVALAQQLISEGTTALLAAGTTGEAPTLSSEEKFRLFKTLSNEVNVPLIANIGTNSTHDSIELAREAEKIGVDGLMAVVPYYNKPNQECLYRHFKAIAEEVSLPVLLYNVPGRTGINMEADTVIELSKIKNIVALKEASGDLAQAGKIIDETEDFLVYSGDDALTLPMMAVGGYGIVSVASQVAGKKMSEMIEAYLEGNTEKAASIHLKLLPLFNNLFITTNPIPVKAAVNMRGINAGKLRLPLHEASEEVKNILQADLKKLEIIK